MRGVLLGAVLPLTTLAHYHFEASFPACVSCALSGIMRRPFCDQMFSVLMYLASSCVGGALSFEKPTCRISVRSAFGVFVSRGCYFSDGPVLICCPGSYDPLRNSRCSAGALFCLAPTCVRARFATAPLRCVCVTLWRFAQPLFSESVSAFACAFALLTIYKVSCSLCPFRDLGPRTARRTIPARVCA